MWSVAEAKAQLSEVLRRARAGAPQFIGVQDRCVVISEAAFKEKFAREGHDGAWLIEQGAVAAMDISLPPRDEDRSAPDFGA
jgi:prevent-host-death family protein